MKILKKVAKANNMQKTTNKKAITLILISILVIISIILFFFFKNDNKNLKFGNNLNNKTLQEIEEYILNISSYEAEIEIQVESNKNQTKYILKQSYVSPNIEKQIVKEPKNIEGLEATYDGNKLSLHNSKLNLTTVYENYQYLTENFLWLNSFIEDYKNTKTIGENTKLYEENGKVIMEVNMQNKTTYVSSKKLIIDKTAGKIEKLIVQDKNKKNLVYILYNEMKINSLKKEEVLAFRLQDYSIAQY